jgi:hypothetical protein
MVIELGEVVMILDLLRQGLSVSAIALQHRSKDGAQVPRAWPGAAQDRGRAWRAAFRAHPRHLRRRLLRRPDHPLEVAKAYDRYLDGAFLRQGQARGSFEYAGILFEEYRGKVGAVDFTDASKAYFFPVGMPGLFRQYNAPADFVETANTIGLPRYAKQAVDQQFARWVMLHVQSNPLPICTRPRVLIKGKRT